MTSRALRFGIVIGDSLVEERIVTRGPITLGQSLRCTLSVPVDGVPREHVLVTEDRGRFVLHGPGKPPRVLETGARCKLQLGEATILVHEIAAPPPPPRLPASLRRTLAERIDGRLAVIVGASLLVHVGVAVCAWAGDVELPVRAERPVAGSFIQDTIEISTVPVVAPGPGPATTEPARPAPHRAATAPSRITHDDATRLAAILTGEPSDRGPAGMSRRLPGADLAQQLDEARTRTVSIGDDGHTSRTDDRARLGTTLGPELAPPELAKLPARTDEQAPGRLRIGPVEQGEPTSLAPEAVLAKIQRAYLSGLQRCYAQGLRGDPALAGKLALSFTVSERGTVVRAEADGLAREIDACVEHLMSLWRFAIPRDAHGEPADADFRISLACQHG